MLEIKNIEKDNNEDWYQEQECLKVTPDIEVIRTFENESPKQVKQKKIRVSKFIITEKNAKNELEKELLLINKIIEDSIWHGGDLGGAYYQNGYELKKSINNYLKYKKIDGKYVASGVLFTSKSVKPTTDLYDIQITRRKL